LAWRCFLADALSPGAPPVAKAVAKDQARRQTPAAYQKK
jgi:hypothetical protein